MPYRAILGTCIARTAMHVGTGEGRDVTDDLCRRDAEGNYMFPGTAIGGALRTIATRLAPRLGAAVCKALQSKNDGQRCGCMVCHLFGEINPSEGDTEEAGGRASRLVVAHARACLPQGKTPRIRDGVGIDRASRTAARAGSVKFDLGVLPRGTGFERRVELEDTDEGDDRSLEDERLLAAALAEWQAGRAWLGGRVARGLGALDLAELTWVERDLSNIDGLMSYLASDTPWEGATPNVNWLASRLSEARTQVRDDAHCPDGVSRSFVTIRFDVTIEGPFLTNDTMAAVQSGFDHAPLLDIPSTNGKPILTGASLRGVLRSQAERIARTLATLDAPDQHAFLAICPACNPLEIRASAPLANCDTLLRNVGRIPDDEEVGEDQLCLACRLFGSTRRGSHLIVEDAEADASTPRKVLDFLAIDRFTGGGKEGAKFDAIAVWQPRFHVRIHVENPAAWELGWLMLVLRDLADGMLPVGFGVAKGFGQGKIVSCTWDYGFIQAGNFAGPSELLRPGMLSSSGLHQVISWDTSQDARRADFHTVAQLWVDEFHRVRTEFRRPGSLRLACDTYFDGDMPSLYKKEAYQWLREP